MDEHDDDLESEVQEGAELERDAFPEEEDELDEPVRKEQEHEDDFPSDPDQAEL